MIEHEILQTLQTAAIAAVTASSVPTLAIKCIDITFEPPNDQKYLELVYIPNNDNGAFWGTEKIYQGIFRLILHWPNDGKGPYEAMMALASIAGYFSKYQLLQNVQITSNPDLTGVLEQGSEILYPASVRYLRFK
jgi:Bacteriophage related domain of unknown function